MFDIENIIRDNIKKLAPYTTARHEFVGEAEIFLDANENAFGSPVLLQVEKQKQLNRYPDPVHVKLKQKISNIKGVPTQNIFVGNGSDEAIDVLIRMVAEPRIDNVIICPPTYGMYKVCADINAVQVREVPLTKNFQLDVSGIQMATDNYTKIIFICSPNNPTGNSMLRSDMETIIKTFNGLVVIDEAYINFSKQKSLISTLTEHSNVVVMQTLSKAWGLAALRVGMAFASEAIINYMNKVKYPYNVNEPAQQLALQALNNLQTVNDWTVETIKNRSFVENELLQNKLCNYIVPSDANFILVNFTKAFELYNYLCTNKIIVRDRSKVMLCENCLRITIGTLEENEKLITAIKLFYN